MNARGESMLDELALKRAKPDPEARGAICMLIKMVQDGKERLEGAAIKGFADGFLMEHPEIAKAYTARQLVDRVAIGFTGFISDVASYSLSMGKSRRPA